MSTHTTTNTFITYVPTHPPRYFGGGSTAFSLAAADLKVKMWARAGMI
uniref:Uncharacterized protein n=1 Tax=Rhizophora mucronata TaxID=61149 RepID=A0A2P2PZG8_RHIMU